MRSYRGDVELEARSGFEEHRRGLLLRPGTESNTGSKRHRINHVDSKQIHPGLMALHDSCWFLSRATSNLFGRKPLGGVF